jgi:hypothetical protein
MNTGNKNAPPAATDGATQHETLTREESTTMPQTASYPHEQAEGQHAAATAIVTQLAAVQETALKTALRELLGTGKHQVAGLTVSITPNRRFNSDAAEVAYPRTQYPELYTLTLDSKKTKNAIPPGDYDALMLDVGDPRVSLR